MKRLIAIQQGLKAEKSKTAKVQTKNGSSYTYQYRDAEQILEAVKPLLAEQKCAVICNAHYEEINGIMFKRVTAHLVGEDGQVIASADDMVKAPGAADRMTEQQMSGCDTTYCKRYALQNLFAIDNSDDDLDSNNNPLSHQNRTQPVKVSQPQPAAAPAYKSSFAEALSKANSAFELQQLQIKLDTYLQEGKMHKDAYDKNMIALTNRGRVLQCTYTDADGWVANADLFSEE